MNIKMKLFSVSFALGSLGGLLKFGTLHSGPNREKTGQKSKNHMSSNRNETCMLKKEIITASDHEFCFVTNGAVFLEIFSKLTACWYSYFFNFEAC